MLSVTLAVGGAERGWQCIATKSVPAERGAKLTFGRSGECDLEISGSRYFSRTHGRFYLGGTHWRVRREGDSELRMWFDFGNPGTVTCHGAGSNLRLAVNEGRITFRPPGTAQDVRLHWSYSSVPAVVGEDQSLTLTQEASLRLPAELSSPRFGAFLLVLCHRQLLKLDYTAPSVEELALWASSRRGEPLAVSTVQKDYLAKLRGHLQNLAGSRTLAHRESSGVARQHAEFAMMAQDVVDTRIVTCDDLIECIRSGRLPNFPDLGWAEGRRG